MYVILILVGLIAGVLFIVLPIVALVTANRASRENEQLAATLREQALGLANLERRLTKAIADGAVGAATAETKASPVVAAAAAHAGVTKVAAAPPSPPAATTAPLVAPTSSPAAPAPTPPPVAPLAAPLVSNIPAQPALPPLPPVPSLAPAATPTPAPAAAVRPPPLPASAVAAAMADAKAEAEASAGFTGSEGAAAQPASSAAPRRGDMPPPFVPLLGNVPPPPPEPAKPFNWEQFLGVKALAWVAGFAFFLGAVYLLILSVQNAWISQEVQAGMIFVAGGALLAGGWWADGKGYRAGGQSLIATGVVVLYAVTFACKAHYPFPLFKENVVLTFGLMSLITTVAFLLAVRLHAQVVAILGLLGGFLTPVLISSDKGNTLGLFSYLTFLNLGLLAVALRRQWHYLVLLAALGTGMMEIAWATKYYAFHELNVAFAVVAWFSVLFPTALGIARFWSKVDDWLAAGAMIPPLVAAGFAGFFLSDSGAVIQPLWIFSTILVADLALLSLAVLHAPLARLQLPAGLGAMGLTAGWIIALDGAAPHVSETMLPWALGFVLLLAAIHVGFPYLLQRFHRDVPPSRAGSLFPPLALLVLFVPVITFDQLGGWLWPVTLLLDLLAITVAALSGALLALAAVIVLTLVLLACAIFQLPPQLEAGGSTELWLVAGFALLFCAATTWLVRRIAQRASSGGDSAAQPPAWSNHLPSFSAALPFALLVLLVLKLSVPNPSEIFGVGLLLVGLLLGLGTIARQSALVVVALLGVLLLEYTWHAAWFARGAQSVGLSWYLGFALLFTAFPFFLRQRLLSLQGFWASAALALPLHFFLIYRGALPHWPGDTKGLLALIAAVPPLLGLVVLVRSIPADAPYRLNRLAWFGATTLFFITLVFPLQFSNQWLTVSWALEGAALLWLFHRLPHPGLRIVGVALLAVVFARLALNPFVLEYRPRGELPILNWILYTYGIAAAACFVGAKLLAPPRDRVFGLPMPTLLQFAGALLAFYLVNLEVADFFTPVGAAVTYNIAGEFSRDMTLPIAWAGFALVLLRFGIRHDTTWPRLFAAALLVFSFLRLLVHDGVFTYRGEGLPAWLCATYGAVIAALFLAGHWYRLVEGKFLGVISPRFLYRTLGVLLLFLFVNLQIAEHFTTPTLPLELEFTDNLARDTTYTISWALFALVLLVYGFWKRVAAARYSAIGLLGITLLKLFFVDLANLHNIWRVVALMGVAVIAFAATFLYQRFFGVEKKPS